MPSSPTRLIPTQPCPRTAARSSRRISSNTGRGVGDRAAMIAASTSPDAVCCSSASFVSLNRRTFSIAIAAWSANVSTSAICFAVNGLHRATGTAGWRRAAVPRASAARPSVVRWPNRCCDSRPAGNSAPRVGERSRDVDRSRSINARPATDPRSSGIVTPRRRPVEVPVAPIVSLESRCLRRSRMPRASHRRARGALGDRLQHRPHVGRRAEITRRISLIAVCWSSASFVSLNRRTLSIAIAAWRANVSTSATWSGANRPGSCARR